MTELTLYDFSSDSCRPATQADIDQMQSILAKLSMRPIPLDRLWDGPSAMNFKLAVYPNPMRDDGVFVAEEKIVQPYQDIRGMNGELLYPTTPETDYRIGTQIKRDFANTLVYRWNSFVK